MTLIYFILILGIIVFIHELGHFIFAKTSGIYVYEFSIGMGPKILSKKRKNDETVYSLRLLPIGGFVSMAGESIEVDENVPVAKRFQSKKWYKRVLTVTAGVIFNFLLAFVLLFVIALINGAPTNKTKVGIVDKNYDAYNQGLEAGDVITSINGKHVGNSDALTLQLQLNIGKKITLTVKKSDGSKKTLEINPTLVDKNYLYGFSLDNKYEYGFLSSIKYAFTKTGTTISQMAHIIGYLVTGKLQLDNLSGPVGIYQVVGQTAKTGFLNILFLIAYISINVGFVNLVPLPAFDGGRLLFLIIEKITGKPLNSKIENTINSIGFVLLMMLMVLITYNDILRLFK